jgi:hypothetical protein
VTIIKMIAYCYADRKRQAQRECITSGFFHTKASSFQRTGGLVG